MKEEKKILAIIVTYNAMPWIQRCIQSLFSSSLSIDIIIIDNGSTDGTQNFIDNTFPQVTLIQNKENIGFGRANNIGLQKVLDDEYDYAYLLNQDAWIFPDTLNRLIDVHTSYPQYGILSPIQMEANMQNMDHNFLENVAVRAQNGKSHFISDAYLDDLKEVYDVPFVMAAHWLISHECIESIGGFSPTFPHYGEDDNYLSRAFYWNYKVGIVPSAKAVHDRENRPCSEEKRIYITKYIQPLIMASTPSNRIPIMKYIKAYIRDAWHPKATWQRLYAKRFWNERKTIEINYQKSLERCAFLIPKNK